MGIFLDSQRRLPVSASHEQDLDAILSQMRTCFEAVKKLRGWDEERSFVPARWSGRRQPGWPAARPGPVGELRGALR